MQGDHYFKNGFINTEMSKHHYSFSMVEDIKEDFLDSEIKRQKAIYNQSIDLAEYYVVKHLTSSSDKSINKDKE